MAESQAAQRRRRLSGAGVPQDVFPLRRLAERVDCVGEHQARIAFVVVEQLSAPIRRVEVRAHSAATSARTASSPCFTSTLLTSVSSGGWATMTARPRPRKMVTALRT